MIVIVVVVVTTTTITRGDHFRFDSVFIKKNKATKPKKKIEEKKKTETSSNLPVSVRFGFFRTKTGSNRFGSVFLVWLGFFRFQAYKIKTEPNWSVFSKF